MNDEPKSSAASPASPIGDAVQEVGRDDLKRRAKQLLTRNGWKPGDQFSAHSTVELMVALAIDAVKNPPDRCGWPECGCCHDASCNEASLASDATPAPTSGSEDGGGPTYTVNCCNCGRIIDTREADEGGDGFGAELSDGSWTCSPECWDAVVEPDTLAKPASEPAGGDDGYEWARSIMRERAAPAEPVAWRYELASAVRHNADGSKTGENWNWRLTEYKPNVPEWGIRNLTALGLVHAHPAPATVESARAEILKTALQRIGFASALSINAKSAGDALAWCRAVARTALEAALAPATEGQKRS